jgi:hypothetical protein
MKMRFFSNKTQNEEWIQDMKMLVIIGAMAYGFGSLIFYMINQVEEVQFKQVRSNVGTSDIWHDNFDSTYIFNGCVHYTHKQKTK